ncbi:hypothetical protein AAFF_G00312710 [Aldrovandia affinis]|uniref:ASD2 domain-containing protein n=1 Tax=Aldrovandia affinis TaxID=143900 RepID=A0AAD7SNB4_9TELE|nr:hypothetical protein AAFF_G00312710 [Aldrovandia affinis]
MESLHPPSQGSSDNEADGAGRDGGSRTVQQYFSLICRENRSLSCPPSPSPLCHPKTPACVEGHRHSAPEQLLTALGVLGPHSGAPQDRWGDRRCSTPDSVGVSDPEGPWVESVSWGHTLSVPEGAQGGEAIVDPLPGPPQKGVGEEGYEAPQPLAKPSPSLQPCLPTSHRSNKHFATNLHTETQQGKALLSLTHGEEQLCGSPAGMKAQPGPPAQRNWGAEQPVPPGRARRWRWTPEHKLQPEFEPEGRGAKLRPSPRWEENDIIPPFADRMRFFEETSRSRSVSHLPGLTCRANKPKAHPPNQRRFSYQECGDQKPQFYWTQAVSCTGRGEPSNPEQSCSRAHRPEEPELGPPAHGNSSLCDPNGPCTSQPVTAPGQQDRPQQQPGLSQRTESPTEEQIGKENEQTKLNRKLTRADRDRLCTGDLKPAEGAVTQDSQDLLGGSEARERLLVCGVEEEAEQTQGQGPTLWERESAVCVDLQQPHRPAAPLWVAAQDELPRRKKQPPPRPPPPNWEQFHHRRASCHSLLSSPPSAPPSPPRWATSTHPLPHPAVPHQRSHSAPLREGGESQANSPALTPGPMLTDRVFRPVAPPAGHEVPLQLPGPPRLATSCAVPEPRPRFCAVQVRPPAEEGRCDTLERQAEAKRERRPACDTQHSLGAPVRENGSGVEALSPESYFTMTCEPRRLHSRAFSGIPEPRASSTAVGEGGDAPFQTDIVQFGEGQRAWCSARPTAVQETDLDSLPEARAPPPAARRAHGGSLVDLLLEGGSGASTRADLLGELFPHSGEAAMERETWRGGGSLLGLGTDTLQRHSQWGSSATQGPGSRCCSYYSTSSAKAKLLSQDTELPGKIEEDEDDELSYKKQRLMECARRKLAVLQEVQRGLQEDVRANTQLGEEVEALVLSVCRPGEVERYRMLIGDLDKVVSLLLSLSSRLLRVETALEGLSADKQHNLRLPLLEKKQQLLGQLTEAQELKEHIDGRQRVVCRILGRCLTPEQLRDYSHFLRMKAALLVEQRQLEDRIRLCKEQLWAVRESPGHSNSPPAGLGHPYY